MRIHFQSQLKALSRRRARESGGVMILALLITACATVGFVAWGNLIAQRTQNVEQAMGGTQRRIAVENGRQLAREYAYRERLTKGSGADFEVSAEETSGQVIGGISVSAWSGNAFDSNEYPIGYNKFSPAATGIGFGPSLEMLLPYSVTDYYPDPTVKASASTRVLTVVKSRSPLTSGDMLVIHAPTRAIAPASVTGSFDVMGGASFLVTSSPANFNSVRALAFNTPSYTPVAPSGTVNTTTIAISHPTSGANVLPSNFPSLHTTTGPVDGSTALDELNRLNVVDPASNTANSLKSKLQNGGSYGSLTFPTTADHADTGNGISFASSTGTLTIDLSVENMPWLVLNDNIAEIKLIGAASSSLESAVPAAICYVENGATTTRAFTKITSAGGTNKRRVLLGLKKISALVNDPQQEVACDFDSANPIWKMMFICENTPLKFNSVGGGLITLIGGIQTDSSLVSSSTISGSGVRLEMEAAGFQSWPNKLLPRRAWVEAYLDFDYGNL